MALVFTHLNNCDKNNGPISLYDVYDGSLVSEVVDQRKIVTELQRKLCEVSFKLTDLICFEGFFKFNEYFGLDRNKKCIQQNSFIFIFTKKV